LEFRHAAWLGNVKIQPVLHERRLVSGKSEDRGFDAHVFITAEVQAARPGKYLLSAEAGGAKVTSTLELSTAPTTAILVLPMEQPRRLIGPVCPSTERPGFERQKRQPSRTRLRYWLGRDRPRPASLVRVSNRV
jgi:hypothetical protein